MTNPPVINPNPQCRSDTLIKRIDPMDTLSRHLNDKRSLGALPHSQVGELEGLFFLEPALQIHPYAKLVQIG